LPSRDVLDVVADSVGNVWIATAGGVVRWRDDRFTNMAAAAGVPSVDTRAIALDAQEVPYFATANGVSRFENGVFVTLSQGLPSLQTRDLEVDSAGALWVATDNGLAKRVGQGFQPVAATVGRRFVAVDSLPDGRVLGGSPDGLFVVHPSGVVDRLTFSNGLPATSVLDIYVAPPVSPGAESEAWLATQAGVSMYIAEP
jgi:ligand-binding sensor domain-containing protein